MRNLNAKGAVIFMCLYSFLIQAQEKSWWINAGYSISAQTFPIYYTGNILERVGGFFQVTDWHRDIHFFYIGAERQIQLSKESKSILVAGIYFSKKGFKNNWSFVSSGNEYSMKDVYQLYHINFPLYIQRTLYSKLKINYGIVPSLMLYNRHDNVFEIKVLDNNAHMPATKSSNTYYYFGDKVNLVDLAIRLGLSYPINTNWEICFNYDKGLINVNRNSGLSLGFQNLFTWGVRYKLHSHQQTTSSNADSSSNK